MNKVLKEALLRLQSQANNVTSVVRQGPLSSQLSGVTDWTLREEALEHAHGASQHLARYQTLLAEATQEALANGSHLERSAALTIISEISRGTAADLEKLSSMLAKAYALA